MQNNLEKRVLLLALYTRAEDETFQDVLLKLEATHVFSLKEGKKLLKALKKEGYAESGKLTLKGIEYAKEIEKEFKI